MAAKVIGSLPWGLERREVIGRMSQLKTWAGKSEKQDGPQTSATQTSGPGPQLGFGRVTEIGVG